LSIYSFSDADFHLAIGSWQLALPNLLLAFRAVVAAAAGDDDSLDGSFANQAGLAFAAVDAMLELEESLFAIGVDVV
jgi:hypothetical protein